MSIQGRREARIWTGASPEGHPQGQGRVGQKPGRGHRQMRRGPSGGGEEGAVEVSRREETRLQKPAHVDTKRPERGKDSGKQGWGGGSGVQ